MTELTIPQIDADIDAAVDRILCDKTGSERRIKPHYAHMIRRLAELPEGGTMTDRRLARGFSALRECYESNAQCLSLHPLKVAELFNLGRFVKPEYISANIAEPQLFKTLVEQWEKEVKPLLALRIEKYGRSEFAAEALNKTMTDWFETSHVVLDKMMQPEKTSHQVLVSLKTMLQGLQSLNSNKEANGGLAYLLDEIERGTVTEKHIDTQIDKISAFTMPAKFANKEALVSAKVWAQNVYKEVSTPFAKRSLGDLMNQLSDLVVMPYMETPELVKAGRSPNG